MQDIIFSRILSSIDEIIPQDKSLVLKGYCLVETYHFCLEVYRTE